MNPGEIMDSLQSALRRDGFESSTISADHVSELRGALEGGIASGLIDDGLHRQFADDFDRMLNQDFSWARSVIVIAAPRPALEVIFKVGGKKYPMIIPPTYEHSIDKMLLARIGKKLLPGGFRLEQARLPLKLLATRSGLARYGKNNITYVGNLGSFYRIVSFYTDLAALKDSWQEPQMLEECAGCIACTRKCPTGAIDPRRFRLHAERCLTYFNESSDPFPSWINKSWHHCLIGCMNCQHFCPVNRRVRNWKERFAELTEDETSLILRGTATAKLPWRLIAKFLDTGLLDDPIGLARNLKSVLAKAN